MAATTITGYSVELNQGPPGSPQLYAPVKANQHRGKIRNSNATLTFASQVSGTSFAMCILPKGSRILGGNLAASATLANSATLSVGLAGISGIGTIGQIDDSTGTVPNIAGPGTVTGPITDAIACLKAAAVQGTTKVPFAITQALGWLYETAKDTYVTITTGTGTVSTEVVQLEISYMVE